MKIFIQLWSILLLLTACEKAPEQVKVKVAATSIPHAEILEQIIPDMESKGFRLEVVVIDDYHIPNRALADGEVDANFFQHLPFLKKQKEEFRYPLEVLAAVHIEPMGIYSVRVESLGELEEGASVAIPADPSNQARALRLLARQGVIALKDGDGDVGIVDVLQNEKKVRFIEIDSALLVRALEDADIVVITTNFALQGGLSPLEDALALEDDQSEFVNVVAIRAGTEEQEKLKALKAVITSEKVRDYIHKRYQGAVIPVKTF